MTKEEIKDFIDVSSKEDIINFIFETTSERNRYKKGVEDAKLIIDRSVSKEKYNSLVKKYNKLVERKEK